MGANIATIMKHLHVIALLALLVVGCDFRSSVKVGVADSKKMESRGVTFLVPVETSSSQDGDFGFKFDGETVKAETKGDILYVGGKSYGVVKRGDAVDLTSPKKVVINGVEKQPVSAEP